MESETAAAIKDLLPLPSSTEPSGTMVANRMEEQPTESHALAMAHHQGQGAAQVNHDEQVVDLGWNEEPGNIANPLIGGLSNEDLWVLVRRFNKVQY